MVFEKTKNSFLLLKKKKRKILGGVKMNPEDGPDMIRGFFENANGYGAGALPFDIHEFFLKGLSSKTYMELQQTMIKKMNEAACETLISFYQNNDEFTIEDLAQGLRQHELHAWNFDEETCIPNFEKIKTSVYGVLVPANGHLDTCKVTIDENGKVVVSDFKKPAFVKSDSETNAKLEGLLKQEYRNLVIAFDRENFETSDHKFNEVASAFAGFEIFGTAILCLRIENEYTDLRVINAMKMYSRLRKA